MRPKVTWVLLADGQNAAVYANDGIGKGLVPLSEFASHREGPDSHEMMTDRAGHRFGGAAKAGSGATLPRNDPHEFEEKRFVEAISEKINRAALENRFDRLIVAAPPRALGQVRQALSKAASGRLAAEVNKDLIKDSPAGIAEHLKEYLAA
jgi:protein required for attachment to host cells